MSAAAITIDEYEAQLETLKAKKRSKPAPDTAQAAIDRFVMGAVQHLTLCITCACPTCATFERLLGVDGLRITHHSGRLTGHPYIAIRDGGQLLAVAFPPSGGEAHA